MQGVEHAWLSREGTCQFSRKPEKLEWDGREEKKGKRNAKGQDSSTPDYLLVSSLHQDVG